MEKSYAQELVQKIAERQYVTKLNGIALPMISSKLRGKETMLWLIGLCFALLVAGSRIVMGAHFLTDVTVGFAITWIIELCALFLIRKKIL